MVLRCSLLGHDYGDPEVEREREERGSEVVVTVQEYEECARCGDRNVISENTEVTSISSEIDGDELSTDPDDHGREHEHESTASDREPADATSSAVDDEDAELIDAAADADADTAAEDAHAASTAQESPDATATDAVDDDGEILEDDDDGRDRDSDREHGEWPDSSDVGPPVDEDGPTEWPDADVTDPTEDDAVVLEHDSSDVGTAGTRGGADAGVEAGTEAEAGAEAEADPNAATGVGGADVTADLDAVDEAAQTDEEPTLESGSGIERDGSVPVPTEEEPADDDVPTEFYCPRCDYVAAETRASLRAGDICPDCRKGYLGERPRH
ncbi:DUF7093 family protein [Halobiforma nitratireducens]|uniref:Uncharacterized protein n=1 Tax=Halobiforma nitratireducens JCM 10879 TaxID=1227454 RepID=M0LLJ9_9EURY|nr:hypothetical protein [Halobiforma nitratireducens]EMA33329.1 hypothetical protein C446_13894 [Halobiforma nitratireducens JCM 10879]